MISYYSSFNAERLSFSSQRRSLLLALVLFFHSLGLSAGFVHLHHFLRHHGQRQPYHFRSCSWLDQQFSSLHFISSTVQKRIVSRNSPHTTALLVSKLTDNLKTSIDENNDDDDLNYDKSSRDDQILLRQTKKSQLVDLCQQFELPTKGSKDVLLKRLRDYAQLRMEQERELIKNRKKRIEEGSEDERERYEVIDDDLDDEDAEYDDDDDDVYFYYESQAKFPSTSIESRDSTKATNDAQERRTSSAPITQQTLTAVPPGPGVEPDENGERVVTVYSTTDNNDLTGVAAAQPGSAASFDPMTSTVAEPEHAPWDIEKQQNQKTEASLADMQAAKEEVTELVQSLLAMSGAPGFQGDDDDEYNQSSLYGSMGIFRQQKHSVTSFETPEGFVGFNPSKVATDTLNKASQSLRMGRGQVLQDVIREFEVRAVGYDGSAGDDKTRGGGHYRQVSLVRSFLDGYRRAEVRRMARETATMLLDRLVADGIDGLDTTLSSMTRARDDTNLEAGELNDSLIDYLNDAIRQQEKKVDQLIDSMKNMQALESSIEDRSQGHEEEQLEKLWQVEDEDGTRVETFDPKDPQSLKALQQVYEKDTEQETAKEAVIPKSAPEKLLLLLKLLRDRVKIEAAFSHDEKSRNLRVLAYCLKLESDGLRRELIMKEFGSSLDRLDSFGELVASSIEYGESTSHQLQPSKTGSLNIPLLNRIFAITREVKEKQAWKAAGGKATGI